MFSIPFLLPLLPGQLRNPNFIPHLLGLSPSSLLPLPNAPPHLCQINLAHTLLKPGPFYKKEEQYTKKKVMHTRSRLLTDWTSYFSLFSKLIANFSFKQIHSFFQIKFKAYELYKRLREGRDSFFPCLCDSLNVHLKSLPYVTNHKYNHQFLSVSCAFPALVHSKTISYPSKLGVSPDLLDHCSGNDIILP